MTANTLRLVVAVAACLALSAQAQGAGLTVQEGSVRDAAEPAADTSRQDACEPSTLSPESDSSLPRLGVRQRRSTGAAREIRRLVRIAAGTDVTAAGTARRRLYALQDVGMAEALRPLLRDRSAAVRYVACELAGHFGLTSLASRLVDLALDDANEKVRRMAREAALKAGDYDAFLRVRSAVLSGAPARRLRAIDLLERMGLPEAVPILVKAITPVATTPAVPSAPQPTRYILWPVTEVARGAFAFTRRPIPMYPTGQRAGGPPQTQTTAARINVRVREALIALTGVDYGYNRNNWLRWYRKTGKELLEQRLRQAKYPSQDAESPPSEAAERESR